jgi:membrane-associated protease RseP (regulator of RpoE activity)
MLIRRSMTLAAAAAAIAAPLVAQGTYTYCAQGPGTAFGVEGYQCANCGFKTQSGAANTYTFYAEPVVTQAAAGVGLSPGDVIVAVDGNPITTQAGADRFTYPGSGTHTLTVRRGRDRQDISFDLRVSACGARGASASGGGGGGFGGAVTARGIGSGAVGGAVGGAVATSAGSGGVGSNAGNSLRPCENMVVSLRGAAGGLGRSSDALIIVDGVVQPSSRTGEAAGGGRFGFAVDARPVCRGREVGDGRIEYRHVYDAYPSIYAVRAESPADKAGLQAGDVIVKVEGKSVLDYPLLLTGADARNELHLTVRRDGKDINVVMVTTP